MGFFKTLKPLKPTEKGLGFVRTEPFLQLCQRVAHNMLTAGKTWDEVDAQLRDITVRELLPHRSYNADEVCDFYRNHWQLIDGAWLPAVQLMKEATARMAADPVGFLRERGMLPQTPSGLPSAESLERSGWR